MQKTVRIPHTPVSPGLEVVGDMVMKVHVPYSADNITMLFNPYIAEYIEEAHKPGIKVRQVMVTQHTDETVKAMFDFANHNERLILISGKNYTVKLLSIGKERFDGQDFPAFEFLVSWD